MNTATLKNHITVRGGEMDAAEQAQYADYLTEKYGRPPEELTLTLEGDEVQMTYRLSPEPFERIRRITGYLVGTMGHWNNAKTAEEADRVKHGV